MHLQAMLLLLCLSLCQGMSLLEGAPSEEYRITRGRSGHGLGQEEQSLSEERRRRHLLSLVSDVLAASWALESATARPSYHQGRPGHGVRPSYHHQGSPGHGVKNTNDGCYQEACEGRVCQCCNCQDCWTC